ncbi:hypothetical protein M758_11G153500, partial [Ceratodon purpureus]
MAWIRGKLLGAGAFGSVNLAIDREDGGVFAVKTVVVSDASEVAVRAIENEIEILMKLDSKYVVKCFGGDWTSEGGQVMRNAFLEYMPEGCLVDFVSQFASSGGLDEQLLRNYTRSIVEGVEYLHSQGIVHCDIKGRNILVGNGCVKLTDFGSSKRVGEKIDSDVVNCAAKVNGTPLWMAPEVVRQVEQGPASDIWSLGCTVVEMATGRAPWSNFGNHFAALYHIGCTDELPQVPASLSEEAHDFLSHCFQRDPAKRWTSAQLLQHPFLTTRFVAAPVALKAPASPISVMQFPVDSESDLSASFVNSVPTLAAPSLFMRGLVSAQPKVEQQVEENWWSSPASPDSGPWIVVRSPKSASSSSCFVVPEDEGSSPIESEKSEVCESLEQSTAVTSSPAAPVFETSSSLEVVVGCSDADDSIHIQIPKDSHVRHFAISEMDFSASLMLATRAVCSYARFSVLGKPLFSVKEEACLNTSLNSGTISGYLDHEFFDQYSNPQILLYWWPYSMIRKGLFKGSRDFKYLKSGHSDQCTLQLQDENTIHLKP